MPSIQTSQPRPQAPSVGPSQLSSTKRTSCSPQVDAQRHQRLQVDVLDVRRRRLDDHLVLVVVAQTVGVLAVAAVGGPHGRLHVGGPPRPRVQTAQEGGRVEGAGADLGVVRLDDHAALGLPVRLQAVDDRLVGRQGRPGVATACSSGHDPPRRAADSINWARSPQRTARRRRRPGGAAAATGPAPAEIKPARSAAPGGGRRCGRSRGCARGAGPPRRARPRATRAARPAAARPTARRSSIASGVIGTPSAMQRSQTRPPRAAEKASAMPLPPHDAQWSRIGR